MEKWSLTGYITSFFGEKLLNLNQSGFRPSDFCVYQLFAITYGIFETFDCNPPLEVWSVFLDISEALDKVWHQALPFRLTVSDFFGELYNLLTIACTVDSKEFFLTDKPHCGDQFYQEFPKVQFWVHFFFLFTSMTYPTN